jgi:hypothetical protein
MADFDFFPLLLQLLAEEKQLGSAISIDFSPPADWQGQWQYCSLSEVLNLPFTQRYDLAVVNLLKYTNLMAGTQPQRDHALVRLRDLFAKKILLIADPCLAQALRALGFNQLLGLLPDNLEVQIWQFNILSYKPVPDWFNSKFWANPDNWDKFRW